MFSPGSRTGTVVAVNKHVRMVDSETQTCDELLEELLMEKLKEAYDRRQQEMQGSKSSSSNRFDDLDF